jgi:cytochrome c oxidase cbb3-type subunit I/II
MMDPRSTSPGSNMPAYPWLKDGRVNLGGTSGKLLAMWRLGVPYTAEDMESAADIARSQGKLISDDLAEQGVEVDPESDLVAIISYLQRLGRGPQPVTPEPTLTQAEEEEE